jgi:hypothetical protein
MFIYLAERLQPTHPICPTLERCPRNLIGRRQLRRAVGLRKHKAWRCVHCNSYCNAGHSCVPCDAVRLGASEDQRLRAGNARQWQREQRAESQSANREFGSIEFHNWTHQRSFEAPKEQVGISGAHGPYGTIWRTAQRRQSPNRPSTLRCRRFPRKPQRQQR